MDERMCEQLEKILALADSRHESEAVVAVRKAREILSREGLSFGDLASAASWRHEQPKGGDSVLALLERRSQLESEVNVLHKQLEELRAQRQSQDDSFSYGRKTDSPIGSQAKKVASLYESTLLI